MGQGHSIISVTSPFPDHGVIPLESSQSFLSFATVLRQPCPLMMTQSPQVDAMTPTAPLAKSPAEAGLSQIRWLDLLTGIGRDHGFFERISIDHLAMFVQENDTLLVSFDSAARVYAEEPEGFPLGFEMVQKRSWSLLSILSLRDPWFRSTDLIAFFDTLDHAGFFDSFAQVIFLGFGPANGHAACAYSAAAPGASVLASAPAATLDPDLVGLARDGRRDFRRYGDAPHLIGAARDAVILFDPIDAASCAHVSQFRAPHVTRAPLRFVGPAPHRLIRSGALLVPLLRALGNGRLSRSRVTDAIRPVRRRDPAYLWRLVQIAQARGQAGRARRIAQYAHDMTGDPRFIPNA